MFRACPKPVGMGIDFNSTSKRYIISF